MANFISLILILLFAILASFIFYRLGLFFQKNFGINALNIKKKITSVINDLESKNTPKLIKNTKDLNLSIKDTDLHKYLSDLIVTSGSQKTFQKTMFQAFIFFITGLVTAKLFGMYLLATLFMALIFSFYPIIDLLHKRKKRFLKFESQLPDALDFISRALAAGHSLSYAIQGLSQEMSPPLSSEFKILSDQISYGISFDEALSDMTNRIHSQDLNFFIISLLIQKDSGGNLSDILKSISSTIRERLKLKGKVRIFSSEARLSAIILVALPFVVTIILYLSNPQYISLLWKTSSGLHLIGIACAMIPAGILWMYKITDIKV